MSDILFKCWKCFQNIAIPDKAVGRNILCPDCFKQLTVPAPSINYKCTSCGYDLCSPDTYAGDKLKCPSCEHEIVVPKGLSTPQLANNSTEEQTVLLPNEEDDEAKHVSNETPPKVNNATVLIPCPACGKQISQRATLCPNCGEPIKLFSRNNKNDDRISKKTIWIWQKE